MELFPYADAQSPRGDFSTAFAPISAGKSIVSVVNVRRCGGRHFELDEAVQGNAAPGRGRLVHHGPNGPLCRRNWRGLDVLDADRGKLPLRLAFGEADKEGHDHGTRSRTQRRQYIDARAGRLSVRELCLDQDGIRLRIVQIGSRHFSQLQASLQHRDSRGPQAEPFELWDGDLHGPEANHYMSG